MAERKTINVSKEQWKVLTGLKLKLDKRTLEDVIDYLIIEHDENEE